MEVLSKHKVFITGINGFTGKYLEASLKNKGFDVYGSVLSKTANNKHFVCDIQSEESLTRILNEIKPNYIIHLAAISFVAAKDQLGIYNINVFGTINLLNAISKLSFVPNKVLVASSAAVYGNIEGELNERICPNPVNHYGNSKLVMENMTKSFYNSLNIIIVRPFNYTGLGQEDNFLIPKIISHFKQGKKEIHLGNIDVYREYNDVHFIVRCYLDLINSDLKSTTLNVCTGNTFSIKDILDLMEEIAGYKIQVNINPEFVRKNEIKLLKGSPERMCSIIGNFTKEYDIRQTLSDMYLG